MLSNYLATLNRFTPVEGSRRYTFDHQLLLDIFSVTHNSSFFMLPDTMLPDDPNDLPPNIYDVKIQHVSVSFVGAMSNRNVISCTLTHGAEYVERRLDGSTSIEFFRPLTEILRAQRGTSSWLALTLTRTVR